MLEVTGLSVRYGQVEALTGANFRVGDGEIVALLGPNGAGKSSALKAVSGVLDYYNGRISEGSISLDGRPLTGLAAHQLVKMGLAVVAEGRRVFRRLTVRENLEMGAFLIKDKTEVGHRVDTALDLFPQLRDRLKQLAGTLSGGEQQMLAFARAMMLKPKLLLADEPSLGLSPDYVETIFERLSDIGRTGVAVLMAEQNTSMSLRTCSHAYVFGMGRVEAEGRCDDSSFCDSVHHMFFGERGGMR